jgi:hypothetical protein
MARGDIVIPNEDRSAFNHAIKLFETQALHGHVGSEEVLERIKKMRLVCPEGEAQIPDFFEATIEHERSNDVLVQWLVFLNKRASDLNKKLIDFTREEVQLVEGEFPAMQELVDYEDRAMRLYLSSGKRQWSRKLFDVTDADGLYLGLAYRQAQRIVDAVRRVEQLTFLDGQQLKHIDRIEDYGKKAEYMFMWLMRTYARLKGIDHLMSIEHALPKNDLRDKYDLVLVIAGEMVQIQQKTLSTDSHVAEYNQAALREEQTKTRLGSVVDLLLEPSELNELTRNERGGKSKRSRKNAFVQRVSGLFPRSSDCAALIKRLKDKKEVRALSEKQRETRKTKISDAVNVKFLKAIGFFEPSDIEDFNKLTRKINAVEAVVTELVDVGEIRIGDLKTPEKIKEKIQQALV